MSLSYRAARGQDTTHTGRTFTDGAGSVRIEPARWKRQNAGRTHKASPVPAPTDRRTKDSARSPIPATALARIRCCSKAERELAKTRAALEIVGKAHALLETLSSGHAERCRRHHCDSFAPLHRTSFQSSVASARMRCATGAQSGSP